MLITQEFGLCLFNYGICNILYICAGLIHPDLFALSDSNPRLNLISTIAFQRKIICH